MPTGLTPDEQMALAGLLRVLLRLDGTRSEAELEAITVVGSQIADATVGDSPYRQSPVEPLGADRLLDLIAISQQELPDDTAIQRAVVEIRRPEARRAIRSLVFHVAASDVVTNPEWPLLDWLDREWGT